MLKKLITLFIFNTLGMTTLVCQASELDAWQSPQYIFKAFKQIALKNEYRQTKGQIVKWADPIHYQFRYHQLSKNQMVESLFTTHLNHLNSITGHSISQSNAQPNLLIHLTKDSFYKQAIQNFTSSTVKNLERESHCMGSFTINNMGQIIRADIVIPVDHVFSRGLLVSCIVEESTQVMGLPNDSDWVNPSIANDKSKIEFLTGLDYLFLKILYSDEIKAGMSGALLDRTVKKLIKELQESGTIGQAAHTVNSSGLYKATH